LLQKSTSTAPKPGLNSSEAGPLAGLQILDFSHAAAGPICAMYLAMMGADVIKIEPPRGDPVRYVLPRQSGMGTTFLGNNLGKRGIVLDLKSDEGIATAKRLIRQADVALDNFRNRAVMERIGLGFDVMTELNPRIIYVQSSAYGSASGLSGMGSDEWIAQAISGFAGSTGAKHGSGEESRGTAYLDWFTALVNLQAVLVGLNQLDVTGRGMMIETSQYGASLCAGFTRFAEISDGNDSPVPYGSERQNMVPDLVLEASDYPIALSALTQRSWDNLCELIGAPPQWVGWSMADRVSHREEINGNLRAFFGTRSAGECLRLLDASAVPASRVITDQTVSEILLAESKKEKPVPLVVRIPSRWGDLQVSSPPWRFSRSSLRIPGPSPDLGEHQEEIVGEL
jgi:crotonobetainyl-CoA:carnitine CoA-transferase CaiB-like acyl-CoA transferase